LEHLGNVWGKTLAAGGQKTDVANAMNSTVNSGLNALNEMTQQTSQEGQVGQAFSNALSTGETLASTAAQVAEEAFSTTVSPQAMRAATMPSAPALPGMVAAPATTPAPGLLSGLMQDLAASGQMPAGAPPINAESQQALTQKTQETMANLGAHVGNGAMPSLFSGGRRRRMLPPTLQEQPATPGAVPPGVAAPAASPYGQTAATEAQTLQNAAPSQTAVPGGSVVTPQAADAASDAAKDWSADDALSSYENSEDIPKKRAR